MKKQVKGELTPFEDYLGNPIKIGDMVVFAPWLAGRTYEFETGTVIRNTPQKLRVVTLGSRHEQWVFPTACVNIKNLKE